jgi:hypothetical protein
MATYALSDPLANTALTDDQFVSRWEYPAVSSVALTEPKEQAFTFPAKASIYKVVLRNNFLPDWVKPTISAFIGIQNLSENWDSYGGKAINRDLINQSLFTLGQIMKTDSPAPSVVPMGDGGIQIEWHRKQQDLEIVFPAGDVPQFYYRNRSTATAEEGLVSDTKKLIHLLIDLA